MTDPPAPASLSSSVPAGWYAVAVGSPELRWWDGSRWTNHRHTITAPPSLGAPAGTHSNTVSIWIFSVLPLVQLLELWLLADFYGRVIAAGGVETRAGLATENYSSPDILVFEWSFVLVTVAWAVLAGLDYRSLRARGVDRPFHWAWIFLGTLVYAIGRAVVVRRRTGAGVAPMWVFILANVLSIAGAMADLSSLAAEIERNRH